ncbi:hypothetical protein F2Q69_00024236 [Brassica cretica]|uniref:Uncharacterized protein n=1 Tax=Brassica cretica TaxID=69181 RepID=A0A8S9Q2A6_BRACR|nr:hypothetical protein F2Q69_00024236 [Brassica cretica]
MTRNQQEPKIVEVGFEVGTRNRHEPTTVEHGATLPWGGVSSRVNHGSSEKKLFLAPRWLGLRDSAGIDVMSLPPFTLSLDKPRDPALRILPYGYGPVYVVDALAAVGGLVVRRGPPIKEKIAGSS